MKYIISIPKYQCVECR